MENKDFTIIMAKIDRCAAWTLLFTILLYAISGYGMTKGIISYDVASSLHMDWLGPIGLIAFITHAGWATHLALKRWKIWTPLSKTTLISFSILLVLFFGYIHFFYQETQDTSNSNTIVFNIKTLSEFDGKNGQPAYIAVDGLVYNVSSIFKNGMHEGCEAGQDVTKEFYDEHSKSILKGFEIVGTYQKK